MLCTKYGLSNPVIHSVPYFQENSLFALHFHETTCNSMLRFFHLKCPLTLSICKVDGCRLQLYQNLTSSHYSYTSKLEFPLHLTATRNQDSVRTIFKLYFFRRRSTFNSPSSFLCLFLQNSYRWWKEKTDNEHQERLSRQLIGFN